MKGTCPHCGAKIDLAEVMADADFRAIMETIPLFGPHWNLVWAYLELFGVFSVAARRKKIRVLVDEMKVLFQKETFSFKKKTYQVSRAGIADALNTTVHKHFETTLSNHNYLKMVLLGIAEQEAKTAGRQAEADLKGKEDRLRSGIRSEESKPLDASENQRRARELAGGIGQKISG